MRKRLAISGLSTGGGAGLRLVRRMVPGFKLGPTVPVQLRCGSSVVGAKTSPQSNQEMPR
jgi:hypothetical protein